MSESIKIVQLSDCHLFADKERLGYCDIQPYSTLSQTLWEIRNECPDLIINSGDVSGDFSEQSYRHYSSLWQNTAINARVFSVAGNHDQIAFWEACFDQKHGYSSHSLLNGTWRLHLLASNFEGNIGTVTKKSLQLFAETIHNNPHASHLAVLHHPLSDSNVWMDKHYLSNANSVIECLQTPTVKAVFHGHVHTDRCVMINETPVYACPSTCWQWGNTREFSTASLLPGYRVIDLNEDGSFSTQVKYLEKSKN
jgi:Icc protein